MGGGKKKSSTLPTVGISTGGLYGSGTAGGSNTFNPTNFQNNLVKTSEGGINDYLQQLINPTYDSEVFKAQTTQRNNLANKSFENNLINPLASRGLTRGSNVNAMGNTFANTLADLETNAMATEDSRVQNILSSLLSTYQMPYNMMTGLQNSASGLVGQQQSANQNAQNSQSALLNALIGGGSNLIGNVFSGGK